MTRTTFFICFLVCGVIHMFSQNEASKWYFGDKLAMDFMSTPPSLLNNSAMTALEGCSSIADPVGNLLFYTSGDTIWNRLHIPMDNGTGLNGHKSAFQHIIVKRPGANNIFYVFYNSVSTINGGGLWYSIVDMSLSAGNGSVTTKNVQLFTPGLEKVAATLHCNRTDIWILSHEYNTANFRSYLLTAAGLNTIPVISNIGPVLTYTIYGGSIKLSPTGRKIAMAKLDHDYLLFDFDDVTGMLSNFINLPVPNALTAISNEFSADGTKLYALADSNLYQWDLCAGSFSAIVASKDSVPTHPGILQLAPNGKIYASYESTASALSIIQSPGNNLPSAGYVSQFISLGTKHVMYSLPSTMSSYLKAPLFTFTAAATCGLTSFSIPGLQFCDAQSRPVQSISWNFGDPVSGSANTSALNSPSHTFTSPGNYHVKLILHNSCGADTIKQVVAVTDLPQLAVSGKTTICKGETSTFSVSGATTYSWNGTAGTSTTIVSPTITTVYTVSGTSTAGCLGNKSFTVNVEPCSGVTDLTGIADAITVFPNPSTGVFKCVISSLATIRVLNNLGQVIYSWSLTSGQFEIDLRDFPAGVYTLILADGSTFKTAKLTKI